MENVYNLEKGLVGFTIGMKSLKKCSFSRFQHQTLSIQSTRRGLSGGGGIVPATRLYNCNSFTYLSHFLHYMKTEFL